MTIPRGSATVHATDSFDFIYGRFELSGGWTIPYLSTVMTFRQAKESLNLVTEFPGWESISWKLEELFQRDIDWPRVERKIVPYLSNSMQPRFFNSLTVSLVPVASDRFASPTDISEGDWHPPLIPDEEAPGRRIPFGPVTLRYYQEWERLRQPEAKLGKIRWNKDETFCLAIDGQHRLAAIKEIASGGGDLAGADISVLLLLFCAELGFRCPDGTTHIDVLRRLFIDLNKHAKPVSRTRLILLDDRDPTSLCTRSTIGEALSDRFEELAAQPASLPLTLVDWHTDGSKVDRGPYVTSVLTLDWAVQKILNTSPLSDPMQHGAVRTQIQRFQNALPGLDLHSASARLDDCVKQERPFSYSDHDPNEVEAIARSFRRTWASSLTCLFSEFGPYRELIDARMGNGSHVADFSNWYQLYYRQTKDTYGGHAASEYNDLLRRWADASKYYEQDLLNWLAEAETQKELSHRHGPSLAFTVVFQKALLFAWIDFRALGESFVDSAAEDLDIEVSGPLEDEADAAGLSHLRYSRVFVSLLNSALEALPDLLYLYGEPNGVALWQGTLMAAEGNTIDFAEAAAIRGQDILLMAVYSQLLGDHQFEAMADLRELLVATAADYRHPLYRLERVCRSFAHGVRPNAGNSASVRILNARQEDSEDHRAREDLVTRRLEVLRVSLP